MPDNPTSGASPPPRKGLGLENIPLPTGFAYVQPRWDLCIGCGICEAACAVHHFGVINRELSRIRIFRYMTPVPKSLQNVCAQCRKEERECQKACPLPKPAIYYDEKRMHIVVDTETCLGNKCRRCAEACPGAVPRFYPPLHNYALVCDLCDTGGECRPQCVDICPSGALEFLGPQFPQHMERVHPDDKAEDIARKLYPLPKDQVHRPPEEIWEDYRV